MTIEVTRLGNGLWVASDVMAGVETASVGVWVKAGSRSEREGEHGIAHLLEHMAFKGTYRRSARDIAVAIEAVGGDLNAATSLETTSYNARVLRADIPLAVGLLAEILQESAFDPDELRREQNVIVQEIGATLDTPDDLVFDLFQEAAYPGQPIGRPILGTADSVTGFSRGDILAYLERNYRAPAMVLAAAGAVDHADLVALAERHFGDLSRAPAETVPPARYVGTEMRVERDLEQINLVIGLEGVPWGDDRFEVAQVLAGLLGGGMSSRLFQEVREARGLCYAIQAFHWGFEDSGILGVSAATGEDEVNELVSVTLDELARVQLDADDVEVARVKAGLRAGLLMGLESSASRAERLARHLLSFGRIIPVDEVTARIEAVDAAKVRAMAGECVASASPTLAAIGPATPLQGIGLIADRLKSGPAGSRPRNAASPWRS